MDLFEKRVDSLIRNKRDQIAKLDNEINGLREAKGIHDNVAREQKLITKTPERVMVGVRWRVKPTAENPNPKWEYDFNSDKTADRWMDTNIESHGVFVEVTR